MRTPVLLLLILSTFPANIIKAKQNQLDQKYATNPKYAVAARNLKERKENKNTKYFFETIISAVIGEAKKIVPTNSPTNSPTKQPL
jgi:hypothetical protein